MAHAGLVEYADFAEVSGFPHSKKNILEETLKKVH